MTAALEDLRQGAAAILGRELAASERALFENYLLLLVKWQKSHRLIGSAEPGWIVRNLFLDSLLFTRVLPAGATALLDFGSGAGVPGIPLRIVRPALSVGLLEARARRVSFLRAVRRSLSLEIAIYAGRARDFSDELDRRFDVVAMRCAGPIEASVDEARGFVRPGGAIIASGPPRPHRLAEGEWVTVAGWPESHRRLFAIVRV